MFQNRNGIPALMGTLMLAAWAALAARADIVPPNVETDYNLMQALLADVHGIARVFGIDESALPAFNTFTDSQARSFTYSAHDTYQGQPLELEGSGGYDAAQGIWQGQTTMSNGTNGTWTTDWTCVPQPGDPSLSQFDWIATPADGLRWFPYPDFHAARGIRRDPATGQWYDWYQADVTLGGTLVGQVLIETQTDPPSWWVSADHRFNPGSGQSFATTLTGYTPVGGGAGWATAAVRSTPEPASVLLMSIAGLCVRRRRV